MIEVLNVKLIGCHDEEEDIKEQGMEEEEVRNTEPWKHSYDVPSAHITICIQFWDMDPFIITYIM